MAVEAEEPTPMPVAEKAVQEASTEEANGKVAQPAKSFKEESYLVSELKESEKQALEEFKKAISAAAKAGEFSIATQKKEEERAAAAEGKEQSSEANADVAESVAKEPESDLSLWGISLLKEDEVSNVVLLKFLRAREFRVDQSLKMLKNTLLWRKSFGCDTGLLDEEFDAAISSTGFYFGVDKEGHPACYNIIDADCLGAESRLDKLLRWRVQLIEKGIKLLDFSPHGVSSMLQVVDLKKYSLNKKEAKAAISHIINILQDNYPELVSKLMLINVPWYYNALYTVMVSPFLTQRQKSKICIAGRGKASEALFKVVSPEHIPIQYGGLGRQNDEVFKDVKAQVTESSIKAGSVLIVEIQLQEDDEVTWDLSVVGWDVNYTAEFNPTQEGGYTVIVEKSRKIVSQEEPIRNSFRTSSAGSLLLTIDNSASKKRKLVAYRYFFKA